MHTDRTQFRQKVFSQFGNLNIHKRIHSEQEPFQCSLCPKTFKSSGELTRHKQSHSGKRQFQCCNCKNDLNHHVN